MKRVNGPSRFVGVTVCGALALVALGSATAFQQAARAGWFFKGGHRCAAGPAGPECIEDAGAWYWLRSPEQERRVVAGLYNRYCVRCHGVDGRGVWDMPCIPDFTDPRWQASRSDAQLAIITLEGRGAVMPAFRGTLTLEEAWAMARYLRTFVPGSEASRPDLRDPEKPAGKEGEPKGGK